MKSYQVLGKLSTYDTDPARGDADFQRDLIGSTMEHRPNFVFLIPDQLRFDALGCFGNPVVRTPHVDALAQRGTRFTEAFVQHPVCSPSRASFLTGWYPHVRGHRTLTHLLRPDEPNLLRILKDAGYHVVWAGARGDTFAPGVTELSVHEYGFATTPNYVSYFDVPHDLWGRLFYVGEVEQGKIDFDEAITMTAERRLSSPPPEPWVLFVPFMAPHCPFAVDEPWYSMYDRNVVTGPLSRGSGLEPRFKEAIRQRCGLEAVTPEMWREVVAVYYGMVSCLDSQIGRILTALEQTGQAERTVTLFFADHGEYLGDFGLIEKWPSAMDHCITADPLIVSGGDLPAGQECSSMVELIDILPTVLDLAGVAAPHRHFGQSLVPLIEEPDRDHRRYAFTEGGFSELEEPQLERPSFPYDLKGAIQHEEPRSVGRAVAVRDEHWTYVWRLYEPPELYDRRADPAETVNLVGRPEVAAVEHAMKDALLRWQVETSDVIPLDADPRMPLVDLPLPEPENPAARPITGHDAAQGAV